MMISYYCALGKFLLSMTLPTRVVHYDHNTFIRLPTDLNL